MLANKNFTNPLLGLKPSNCDHDERWLSRIKESIKNVFSFIESVQSILLVSLKSHGSMHDLKKN